MSLQSSVTRFPADAVAGMVRGPVLRSLDRQLDAANDNGLLVCDGATPGVTAKAPAASTDVTKYAVGILPYRATQMPNWPPGASSKAYQAGDAVSIVRHGAVWVLLEEDAATTDDVYVRYASGTGTVLGAFRKSADTSTAALLPRSRWLIGGTAGGLALVELNLP